MLNSQSYLSWGVAPGLEGWIYEVAIILIVLGGHWVER